MRYVLSCICFIFAFGGVLDLQAQFVPIQAKVRNTRHLLQPDGTEKVTVIREGFYYRSSAGDEIKLVFRVDEKGNRIGLGEAFSVDASTGTVYEVNHLMQEARVRQQRKLPLTPMPIPHPDQIIEERLINGVRCVAVNTDKGRGKRTIWISPENALVVRKESRSSKGRFVEDFYDIQVVDPNEDHFRIPAEYRVDFSDCFSCPNTVPRQTPARK